MLSVVMLSVIMLSVEAPFPWLDKSKVKENGSYSVVMTELRQNP